MRCPIKSFKKSIKEIYPLSNSINLRLLFMTRFPLIIFILPNHLRRDIPQHCIRPIHVDLHHGHMCNQKNKPKLPSPYPSLPSH